MNLLQPPFLAIVVIVALYALGIVMVVGAFRVYSKVSRILILLEDLHRSRAAMPGTRSIPESP